MTTDKLDMTEQQILHSWIKTNLTPSKNPNWTHSSYALKHCFENSAGLYIDNESFKHSMRMCGFAPVDDKELNHHYYISADSIGLSFRCM